MQTKYNFGYVLLTAVVFFSFSMKVRAGSLEDIKKNTGWEPRIHSEKNETKGFSIIRVDRDNVDSYWEKMKYRVVDVSWKSPQADGVTLKVYVLLNSASKPKPSVMLAQGTYQTVKGKHSCRIRISEFEIERYGNMKDCYVELWYQGKLKDIWQASTKYSAGGKDESDRWWKRMPVVGQALIYYTDPGLRFMGE